MAIFTKLNSNGIVIDLLKVSGGIASTEERGAAFCQQVWGPGQYVQTFEDNGRQSKQNKRNKKADIGDYYDSITDAFYDARIVQNNTRPSRWLNLPNGTSYCINYRVASTTFLSLIVKQYSDPNQRVILPHDFGRYNSVAAPTGTPYAIIRDPVSRFVSAYSLRVRGVPGWYPVDEFIDWMIEQDKTKLNPHFIPQVNIIGFPEPSGITYFDFAKDLTPLATILGLPTPIPQRNKTDTSRKPVLTPDQITKLQNFYSDDLALYSKVRAQT